MQFSKEHHLRCLLLSFLVFLMLVPALEIRDSVDGVKSFSPSVYSQFSYLQSTIYTETVVTVTYTGITTYSYEIGPSGIGKPIPSSKLSESLLPQFSRSPGGYNSTGGFGGSNSTRILTPNQTSIGSDLRSSTSRETSTKSTLSRYPTESLIPSESSTHSTIAQSSTRMGSLPGSNSTGTSAPHSLSTGNQPPATGRDSSGILSEPSSSKKPSPSGESTALSNDGSGTKSSSINDLYETSSEILKESATGSYTSNTVTSTMTTIPPGFSTGLFPESTYSANGWVTTTDENHHTTVLPFIVVDGGRGMPLWNLPPIPHIEFSLPDIPRFHLPCVKFLGMRFGDCPFYPVIDGLPRSGEGSNGSDPEDDHASQPTNSRYSSTASSSQLRSSSSSICTGTATVSKCVARCISTVTSGTSCFSYTTTCSQNTQACTSEGTTSTVRSQAACLLRPATAMAHATQTLCNGGCIPLNIPKRPEPTNPPSEYSPDPDIEKRYIAGRVIIDPLKKRGKASIYITIGGCTLRTSAGNPFTRPAYPSITAHIFKPDLEGNLDPKFAVMDRYHRATSSGCIFTTTRLSAKEWAAAPDDYLRYDQEPIKNNKQLSLDHAYEKGWLPAFIESVINSNNAANSLTCDQANQYFFPSSGVLGGSCAIYLLQGAWNSIANNQDLDFIAMSQYLNGDGKGMFFPKNGDPLGWASKYVGDKDKEYIIPSDFTDYEWKSVNPNSKPWSGEDTIIEQITHFEQTLYGVLEMKNDRMHEMIDKTNNRIYAHLQDAHEFLQKNPGNMFGDLTAYNNIFPNGINGAYRTYMTNIVEKQINKAPQYLTELLGKVIVPNIDTTWGMPDVGKDRNDPSKDGHYLKEWKPFHNVIAAHQKHYRTAAGGYSWDYYFTFSWSTPAAAPDQSKRDLSKLLMWKGKRGEDACVALSHSLESLVSSANPTHSPLLPGSGFSKLILTNTTLPYGSSRPIFTNTTLLHGSHKTTSYTPPSKTSTSAPTTTFTNRCYPFSDPDSGTNIPLCQCNGMKGKYLQNPQTSQKYFDGCIFTAPPTPRPTAVPPFTDTQANGEVLSCASSQYYNAAVNKIPTCAGSRKVISTVASIASAFASAESISIGSAKSAESASIASVSYVSTAAAPSAGCYIIEDDGWGDSAFAVFGINDWAGDGEALFNEESGCGILSGWQWHTDDQQEFQGKLRNTQCAIFGLSFFKGGCVERAVKAAGGPTDLDCQWQQEGEPALGPKERGGNMLKAAKSWVMESQVSAIQELAKEENATNLDVRSVLGQTADKNVVLSHSNEEGQSGPVVHLPPLPELVALAKAALSHLMAAAKGLAAKATGLVR